MFVAGFFLSLCGERLLLGYARAPRRAIVFASIGPPCVPLPPRNAGVLGLCGLLNLRSIEDLEVLAVPRAREARPHVSRAPARGANER